MADNNGIVKRRRGSNVSYVYKKIRDDIINLKIAPGQLIDETVISKRLKVSRSPIREALSMLASEKLIETTPNKHTICSPLHIEEFHHYVDALDLVQRATTRLATLFHNSNDIVKLRKINNSFVKHVKNMNVLKVLEVNKDFHYAIAVAGKNRYLADYKLQLLDQGRRYSRLYYFANNDELPNFLCTGHDLIIDAIEARDTQVSEKLIREHCQDFSDRFIQYISRRNLENFDLLYKDE